VFFLPFHLTAHFDIVAVQCCEKAAINMTEVHDAQTLSSTQLRQRGS
jgi:hypothetical protein